MTINKYKSRTHETKLYSNILLWQSCIYRRWTQILLPSQHSCANSAGLFWWSSWPPCPPSPVSAVHPSLLQSDWIWSWMGKGHRGYHCLSEQRGWGPIPHNLEQEQENTCGKICLPLCLFQTSVCLLLSMRTTTCKTQSKTFYISCCQHSISCQILFHVYNYMLIFVIASLLLSSVCPSAGLFTPSCCRGIGGPCNKSTVSHFG